MSKWGFIGVGIMVLFCWSLWGVFFVMPMYELARTRAWVPSTCEILSSRVATSYHSRNSPPTFRVKLTYRWSHGAETFTGSRYDLNGWDSSGAEDDCYAIVRSLPPGARVGCFVNPGDPREALINRDVDGSQVFAWIMSWGALVLGAFLIRVSVRTYRQSLAA